MKTRESGMAKKDIWNSFFNPEMILNKLELSTVRGDTVEFGCGYGIFALPVARRIQGTLHGFDIEKEIPRETWHHYHPN